MRRAKDATASTAAVIPAIHPVCSVAAQPQRGIGHPAVVDQARPATVADTAATTIRVTTHRRDRLGNTRRLMRPSWTLVTSGRFGQRTSTQESSTALLP
ncbi:hypothetical protein ACQPZJ_23775 [Actinoplanes sp. CA-054009]